MTDLKQKIPTFENKIKPNMKPPIALIVFSNDLDNFLHNVETERRYIEEALEHYDDTNRLKVITRSSVSIDDIFQLFNRYQGRIVLFHFAGHASGEGLQLNHQFTNTELGRAEGIAQLLGREATTGQLQFVFLNGCSTAPQVKTLEAAGIPSVIGTNYPISDHKAIRFARRFYRKLSNADQSNPFEATCTLDDAYKEAALYVQSTFNIEPIADHRGFTFETEEEDKTVIWELFTNNPSWSLHQDIATEEKAFNEKMTEILLKALSGNNRKIKRMYKRLIKIEDWAISDNAFQAKNIIVNEYIGIIDEQLRRLFAIGAGEVDWAEQAGHYLSRERQMDYYLKEGLQTYKLLLQLCSYILIADIWKIKTTTPTLELSEDTQDILADFLETTLVWNNEEYLELLQSLQQCYTTKNLSCAIPEILELIATWNQDGFLKTSITVLSDIEKRYKRRSAKKADCFTLERHLAYLLAKCTFLTQYELKSVKRVIYEKRPNDPTPIFREEYTVAEQVGGKASKRASNAIYKQQSTYTKQPKSSDAIVLVPKTNAAEQHTVNLFPFIIDYHAIEVHPQSKICFFSHLQSKALVYDFVIDERDIPLKYHNRLRELDDIATRNQLLNEEKGIFILKSDMLYLQFKQLKNTLTT